MAVILEDDISECIVLYENDRIPILISLKFVRRCQIDNKPALVQVMAGHKPLHELMIIQLTDAYVSSTRRRVNVS